MNVKQSLGESLVDQGLLSVEQLKEAREEESRTGQSLRKVLLKKGYVTEEDFVSFLSGKMCLPRVELANTLIDARLIELVPEETARRYEVVPVLKIGKRLLCAMADPWNVLALDELRIRTQCVIEPAVATETEIRNALDECYGAKGSLEDVMRSQKDEGKGVPDLEASALGYQESAEEPAVKKIVSLLIQKALGEAASDIHLEPGENGLRTRFRLDGFLHDGPPIPKHLTPAIISRLKILAHLDIAERRRPQDGRFTVKSNRREIDLRVSCIPTIWGESIVLRLLEPTGIHMKLEDIGFSKEILERYHQCIRRPLGMICVTGPTGSGKTTTLYASLERINSHEKNIITLEDPVEYRIPGIKQIQVNSKVNLTFANGLRSVLRQDPNVLMVGEIRDLESAELAIHSAQTGHLVFTTLHTIDAAGALTRLLDMGVEPFMVASSVTSVLAQRLVRTLCPDCKEPLSKSGFELARRHLSFSAESSDFKAYTAKGCEACRRTGYRGRTAIFELLLINESIRRLVLAKAPVTEIRKAALDSGMEPLERDGLKKVQMGLTAFEEILRVVREG